MSSVKYKSLITRKEALKIALPSALMTKSLSKIKDISEKDLSDAHIKSIVQHLLERANHKLYQYIPYFNRKGGDPSWQWHFMAASDRKFGFKGRVALGANRIGKSEQGAYETVLAVIGKHPFRDFPNNGIAWVVGLDNPMIRDIDRPLFESFLPDRFRHKFYKQDNLWEIKGEGREWIVVFKSTEMGREKFQGAKIDFAWVDEEPKKTDIWAEIETRLVDKGGIWWMTATPVDGTKWLKDLSEREDVYKTMAGMVNNPYIPEIEIEKLRRSLAEDQIATRIEGEYITFGGRPVFDRGILRHLSNTVTSFAREFGILSERKT
jgi:phage terminase large subunit-like protein